MKKEDLTNGSIVATRCGYLAVVIKEGTGIDDGHILYQDIGMDDLYLFNDDLTSTEDKDWDIMEVFGHGTGRYSFYDIELDDPMPDWSREIDWQRPLPKEREARMAELEELIKHAKIVDETGGKAGIANIGSKVKVHNQKTDKDEEYTIVSSNEVDPFNNMISDHSPIGVALVGSKKGDTVTVTTPTAEFEMKVLSVSKAKK